MKRTAIVLVAVLVAGVLGYLAGDAAATGVPTDEVLTYRGRLLDGKGQTVAEPTTVGMALFTKMTPDADVAVCAAQSVKSEKDTGMFAVKLPATCVAAVHQHPNLYAEFSVGGATKTVLPRTKLTAVPYALEAAIAGKAAAATGLLKADMDKLAAAKPYVFSFKFDSTSTTSGKLVTHGGRLLISLSGRAYACPGGCAEELEIWVDGKKKGAVPAEHMSIGNASWYDGPLILDNVNAGTATLSVKPSKNNAMAYRASISVVEVPK